MLRIKTRTAAVIIAAASIAGGSALALTGASAASLPSCSGTVSNCTSTNATTGGAAGYYGADDNHTHYRFAQTVVQAVPTIENLNGQNSGGVGAELCDASTGVAAQTGIVDENGTYDVLYAVGHFVTSNNVDPCVQSGLLVPNITSCLSNMGGYFQWPGGSAYCGELNLGNVQTGDNVYLGVYYDPNGNHRHQISFGDCVTGTNLCRQAWSSVPYQLNFTEFGIGAFSNNSSLGGGAINHVATFSDNEVTCYSCAGAVPITDVSPVNPFNIGGLYEAQWVNPNGSQVAMSPNDSLSNPVVDQFTVSNGSETA